MQRILDEHCHHIPAEEVLGILGVDPAKGLDLFEVDHRRERFGPNLLKERKGRNPGMRRLVRFGRKGSPSTLFSMGRFLSACAAACCAMIQKSPPLTACGRSREIQRRERCSRRLEKAV